jgi:hypothetical protein
MRVRFAELHVTVIRIALRSYPPQNRGSETSALAVTRASCVLAVSLHDAYTRYLDLHFRGITMVSKECKAKLRIILLLGSMDIKEYLKGIYKILGG